MNANTYFEYFRGNIVSNWDDPVVVEDDNEENGFTKDHTGKLIFHL